MQATNLQATPFPTRLLQVAIVLSALASVLIGAFVVPNQPFLAILGVLGLLVGLLSLMYPDIATLSFFFILLSNAAVVAVKFHNVPFIVSASFPLLLMIPLVYYIFFRHEKVIIHPLFYWMFGLLAVQAIGTITSIDVKDAFSSLQVFAIEGVLIYVLIVNAVRTPQTLRRVVWVILLSSIFLGIFPIYQQLTGNFADQLWGFGQTGGRGFSTQETLISEVRQLRLAGAIGEKNFFAQIMLRLGILSFPLIWAAQSKSFKLLAIIATGVAFAASILPFSRGGAVGFILLLLIGVPLSLISWKQFVTLIMIAILGLMIFPQYMERLGSLHSITSLFYDDEEGPTPETDGATKGRQTEMLAALIVYAEHPIVGVGPSMYRFYSEDIGNQLGITRIEGERRAHSLYLDVAANTGTLGIFLTFGIIGITLRGLFKARRQWQDSHPELAGIATGLALSTLMFLTTGIFLHFSYIRYFWTLMAVAAATIHIAEQMRKASAAPALPEDDLAVS